MAELRRAEIKVRFRGSTLMLASGGRLSPFTPISDDCGIDLIVLDKKTRRALCIQVKSRIENPRRSTVQFGIRKPSFRDDPNCYLLGVLFNPDNPALTTSWFIPMARVPHLALQKPGTYAVTPAIASSSADRYSGFRFNSARDLVVGILEALDGDTPLDQALTPRSIAC